MKKIYLFTALSLLVISISSCKLDNPLNPIDPKIEPILLQDRYDEDIVLTDHNDDGVDYIASDIVQVFGGKMTIEPGVIIEFEEGAGFEIGIEGRLDAVGTSGEPIRMIAKEGNPSWSGIYINTEKSNKLIHVVIENAGQGKTFGVFNDFSAALTLDGTVSMENSTITKSGDMGIIINDRSATDIREFAGNTIKDCENFPILSNFNYLQALNLSDNSYSDNGRNMVAVTDRYTDRLTVTTELDGLEIPYFLMGDFDLYADLTLNRGVEFVMDQNSVIEHVAGDDFRLQIKGTENDHVVIRGGESENGYWQGLYITSANSSNTFEYLDISDGGGQKLTFGEGKANVSVEFEGDLTMINCTSARSGNCEVFLSRFGGSPSFTNESPAITNVCEE